MCDCVRYCVAIHVCDHNICVRLCAIRCGMCVFNAPCVIHIYYVPYCVASACLIYGVPYCVPCGYLKTRILCVIVCVLKHLNCVSYIYIVCHTVWHAHSIRDMEQMHSACHTHIVCHTVWHAHSTRKDIVCYTVKTICACHSVCHTIFLVCVIVRVSSHV